MRIKRIFDRNGRFAAELESGMYVIAVSSMTLALCEKVETGYKVVKSGIIGGIMMKTEDDFRWCVEHCDSEMETVRVTFEGRQYRIFRFMAKTKSGKREVNVAEYSLNRIIQQRCEEARLEKEGIAIDAMYDYYLPEEIDLCDEREIRESIEDVTMEEE